MPRGRSILSTLLVGVSLLSSIWFTVPDIVAVTRLAFELRNETRERRREIVIGPWYGQLRAIDQSLPEGEPVAVVMHDAAARDTAVFALSYLYPRPATLFWSLEEFAMQRERFGHAIVVYGRDPARIELATAEGGAE